MHTHKHISYHSITSIWLFYLCVGSLLITTSQPINECFGMVKWNQSSFHHLTSLDLSLISIYITARENFWNLVACQRALSSFLSSTRNSWLWIVTRVLDLAGLQFLVLSFSIEFTLTSELITCSIINDMKTIYLRTNTPARCQRSRQRNIVFLSSTSKTSLFHLSI